MRQHGLALFVRPHNAQRARLPTTTPNPAGHFADPPSPLRIAVVQVRDGGWSKGEGDANGRTMFDKGTRVLAAGR